MMMISCVSWIYCHLLPSYVSRSSNYRSRADGSRELLLWALSIPLTIVLSFTHFVLLNQSCQSRGFHPRSSLNLVISRHFPLKRIQAGSERSKIATLFENLFLRTTLWIEKLHLCIWVKYMDVSFRMVSNCKNWKPEFLVYLLLQFFCCRPFLAHLSQRLTWAIVIAHRPSSVRKLSHFRLLLWNHWTEFNETWQEARS